MPLTFMYKARPTPQRSWPPRVSRGCTASQVSAPCSRAAALPLSTVCPVALRYGKSAGRSTLRSRNSAGDRPACRAAASISRSSTKVPSGCPAPRNGPVGVVLVYQPRTARLTAGMR